VLGHCHSGASSLWPSTFQDASDKRAPPSTLRNKLMVHSTLPVKKDYQHYFSFWAICLNFMAVHDSGDLHISASGIVIYFI
jgi:hypothetical protein